MRNYIQKIITLTIIISLFLISYTFAKTGTIQNSDFLNLRESPSTSANLLTKMSKDATFEILSEEGDWYKIQYNEYTGYVSKQYVKVNETIANNSIKPKSNSKGVINTNSDVYVLPMLNSSKIGNLNSNTEVLVVSITGKWAYVQNDNISGWVFTNNINGTEEQTNYEDTVTENNKSDNNSENNIQENNTTQDTNKNENQGNNIEQNQNNQTDSNTEETSQNYPQTMYVNVEAVYVRAQPTTESNAVASVGINTPVTVKGEEGDWYKVEVSDGSGYMMKKFLSKEKQ